MDNVPSSAILAIVAIVLACLFAAFAFTTVQSQKSSGSNAMVKVEGMNTELDESDLTQYDGQILTGSQVVEVIKKNKDVEGLTISTANANATKDINFYGNNITFSADSSAVVDAPTGAINGTKPETGKTPTKVDTASLKAIGDKNAPKTYITSSAKFRGTVHRNHSTNAIDWIEFTQE